MVMVSEEAKRAIKHEGTVFLGGSALIVLALGVIVFFGLAIPFVHIVVIFAVFFLAQLYDNRVYPGTVSSNDNWVRFGTNLLLLLSSLIISGPFLALLGLNPTGPLSTVYSFFGCGCLFAFLRTAYFLLALVGKSDLVPVIPTVPAVIPTVPTFIPTMPTVSP